MGRFLGFLYLLFSFSAFAAQPSAVPAVGMGQAMSTGPTSFVGFDQFSGTGNKAVFTLTGGNINAVLGSDAGYHLYRNGVEEFVTTGVTDYCFNITVTAPAGDPGQLFYTSTEYANNVNTVPGAVKWQCGLGQGMGCMVPNTAGVWAPQPQTFNFVGPSYPGFLTTAANTFAISMQCFQQ